MLVLDPSKRLSVAQIKEHKWMALYVPVQRPVLYQQPVSAEGEAGVGEYSEQVLRLMHSLGIDQHKTIEVRAGLQGGVSYFYKQEKDGARLRGQSFSLLKWTVDMHHFTHALNIMSLFCALMHNGICEGECLVGQKKNIHADTSWKKISSLWQIYSFRSPKQTQA